jgi:hypothetical protein
MLRIRFESLHRIRSLFQARTESRIRTMVADEVAAAPAQEKDITGISDHMARTCIICGKRAGSREHVFPAALGGRRTNKGIYCGTHNNGFSPLALILSEQLRAINALLAIRSDYSDEPHSFTFSTPDGDRYVLSADGITLAGPQAVVDASGVVTMRFPTQAAADEWLAKQRAAGNDLRVTARAEGREYFSEPLRIPLVFGGPEGLRAIGYLALTFFAHHFPEQVRQSGMSKFKAVVQNSAEGQFVWWDSPNSMDALPENPFAFGHTVALAVSAVRKEAYARISLFSTLNFSVYLGAVDSPCDRTVVVHIDPQAEHAPDDIREVKQEAVMFEVNRPPSLTANLGEMIGSGRAQESVQLLFNKISAWNRERTLRPVLDELNATRGLDEDKRNRRVKEIVNREEQRVLNLMRYVVDSLRPRLEADPSTIMLVPSLNDLVAVDVNSSTGLSQSAMDALEIAKARLANEIGNNLSNGDRDLDRLAMLLEGRSGAAVVTKAITDPIIQRL